MPEDAEKNLAGHHAILFANVRAFAIENEWFSARLQGARVALRSDSVSSIYAATMAGVGIALLPVAVAGRDPALRVVSTRTAPEPRVIWQAIHEDLQQSARVRAVLDFLFEVIAPPDRSSHPR